VNECQEPLTVWVQDLTSESGPSAIRTVDVPAGQTVLVEVPAGVGPAGVGPAGVGPAGVGPAGVGPAGVGPAGGESGPKALEASRVRLWAESSDGELWTEWKEEDLWLVEPSPQLDGRRSYLASDVESYVHRFRPRVSQRVFAEKMLKMTNALPESIKVDLLFESRTESFWTWKRLGIFEIPGNSSMFPKSEFGLSVRASRVRFVAHSESCRFETFKDEPLWLVEDTPSGRRYRADQIGVFDFVFDPARE